MTRESFHPDFNVETKTASGGPVIEVRGELDSGTCQELMAVFRSTLAEHSEGSLTLDLSGVSFIDSAGTRSVIMIEREARDRGVALLVTAPPDQVTELLRTAGVIEHFELTPDVRVALAGGSNVLERVELELPCDPQSPARARAELRELMSGRDQSELGDVVLLTSEIVTNAVVHPAGEPQATIGLRIFTYKNGIRVEVDDGGEGFDPSLPTQPEPHRGRGLFLVDRFASRWGTDRVEGERGRRFVVWFELDWRQDRSAQTASA
jgi:anti-anti-sigma factor